MRIGCITQMKMIIIPAAGGRRRQLHRSVRDEQQIQYSKQRIKNWRNILEERTKEKGFSFYLLMMIKMIDHLLPPQHHDRCGGVGGGGHIESLLESQSTTKRENRN